MATFAGIAGVALSLERLLNQCFLADDPIPNSLTKAKALLVRTEDFDTGPNGPATISGPTLTIFLYRIDFNKTMRAAWSAVGAHDGRAHLPLDLHFLLTPWADDPQVELRIIGKAMECLETTPILGGPLLHVDGEWAPNDNIQLALEELSTEAVMRTFDSLPHDYKLSVPYIARIARIDGARPTPLRTTTTVITGLTASATP